MHRIRAAAAGLAAAVVPFLWHGPAGRSLPAAEPPRDWSVVQLAWRDDPRAAADVPAGDAVQPRWPSRRAARRAARRGLPLDDVPVGVRRGVAAGGMDGIGTAPDGMPPAILSGRQPPISVEATLASPFEAAADAVLAHRDQPYGPGDHVHRRFDIHLPSGCAGGSLPLVVWIAGDDWQGGRRADCPLVWLAERGYAVACVEYRPSDEAVFPAQLDDCRAAVGALTGEAATWGVDPRRVCVVGRGAGGHLAALVAMADPPAATGARRPAEVAAACAIAAPTHLASLGDAHETMATAAARLVGGPLPELREAAQSASPLAHVSADDPPLLIVHGGRDATVPAEQAIRLDEALRAAGGSSNLVLLEAEGHGPDLTAGSPAGAAIMEFLDRVLGPGGREPAPSGEPGPPGPAMR